MIAKRWLFGVLTVAIVACLIGLLALTGESVHRIGPGVQVQRAFSHTTPTARPAVEPETGPTLQNNGLMLTY